VETYEGKITDDISDQCTLTRSHNGDGVVLDANLEEGDDPGEGNEEESYDRRYLEFNVIAQIDKAKG
jgi:hypothetical protein